MQATVTAIGDTLCLKLGRRAFEKVAGSCREDLLDQAEYGEFSLTAPEGRLLASKADVPSRLVRGALFLIGLSLCEDACCSCAE